MARAHVARNPWQAVWVGARVLPAPVRRELSRHSRGPLSVIAAAASGQRELARRRLTDELRGAGPRRSQHLLAAAAATGQLTELDRATGGPAVSPTGSSAAYLAWSAGDVSGAERALDGARNPLARAHRRWLVGERAVLTGSALDGLRTGARNDSRTDLQRKGSRPTTSPASASRTSVVHVVTNSLPEVQAGYTVRTQGLVAAQRDAGIDAHVCTPPGFPVAQGHLGATALTTLAGVPYHRDLRVGSRVDLPDRHLQAYAAAVASLGSAVGADVLHAHSKHVNAQAALLAGERLGVPVVYEARGFLEDTWRTRGGDPHSDFYRWTRETETRCLTLADAVVTLSQSMRDDVVARGVDAARVHVIGNCVPDDLVTAPVDGGPVRTSLDIRPDDVVVGTVSTLNAYEGIDVLVEAGALLDDARLVVLVVGDGPARDRMVRRAAELRRSGNRTRFVLTGRVPHDRSAEHHAAIDVFCVPRRATPVTALVPPLKPVEAMALGRPVVVTDLPPLRELVGADRGVVVAQADPAVLAEALHPLVADPGLRARLGANGRDHVASRRTWSAAATAYEQVYDRARTVAA
ncbi:glycosyltransferase WbuB [Terrabacter tumescens]|uniref:D-inositol 3-phosphate glycosyltransferase n=1 Tax=Terrabacter tumescens TaxID=60443 RepID=A0ABQ2HS10_9MICO|nr:glycosyltransferase family 4 protein [Terrabacter tumescens]GGM89978.1 glycosyltransferase WbuB [Terrabacter tumescens]